MLKPNKAKATGKRATDEYRHWLCKPIAKPTISKPLRCDALACQGTRPSHTTTASTLAVTQLRTATPVATSMPSLKASRAATWLAPIIKAMSIRVKKATQPTARVDVVMGGVVAVQGLLGAGYRPRLWACTRLRPSKASVKGVSIPVR